MRRKGSIHCGKLQAGLYVPIVSSRIPATKDNATVWGYPGCVKGLFSPWRPSRGAARPSSLPTCSIQTDGVAGRTFPLTSLQEAVYIPAHTLLPLRGTILVQRTAKPLISKDQAFCPGALRCAGCRPRRCCNPGCGFPRCTPLSPRCRTHRDRAPGDERERPSGACDSRALTIPRKEQPITHVIPRRIPRRPNLGSFVEYRLQGPFPNTRSPPGSAPDPTPIHANRRSDEILCPCYTHPCTHRPGPTPIPHPHLPYSPRTAVPPHAGWAEYR